MSRSSLKSLRSMMQQDPQGDSRFKHQRMWTGSWWGWSNWWEWITGADAGQPFLVAFFVATGMLYIWIYFYICCFFHIFAPISLQASHVRCFRACWLHFILHLLPTAVHSSAMIEWLWCLEMYMDYVCPDIKSKCCNFWVTATLCSEDMVGAALVGMILKTGCLAVFTFSLCWLWMAMVFLLVVLRLFKDWMRMVETLLGNMEESCGVELLEQSLTLLEADHDVLGTGGGGDVCCLNMLLDKF